MSSTDDGLVEAEASARFLGMGIGTFVVFVMAIAITLSWILSAPCTRGAMLVTRWCSTIVFGLTIILLIFAERRDQYVNMNIADKTYDESIPARIAVSLFMALATVASIIIVAFGPASDSFKTTTHDRETTYLWID